jgi:GxxExxY protein
MTPDFSAFSTSNKPETFPKIVCPYREKIVNHADYILKDLGSGHSEAVYRRALAYILNRQRYIFCVEQEFPVSITLRYEEKDIPIGLGKADTVVDFILDPSEGTTEKVIIEMKVIKAITSGSRSQILKYMRGLSVTKGIIINFGMGDENIEKVKYEYVDLV